MSEQEERKTELERLIDEFLKHIEYERGCAQSTVLSYRIDLQQLVDSLKKDYPEILDHPDKITAMDLRGFLAGFRRGGYAIGSIHRKISSARSFFSHLYMLEIVDSNPARALTLPKLDKPLPSFLDLAQTEKALEIPDTSTPLGTRDRAILEVLYNTGMRASELISMKISDLDLESKEIKIMGKGSKERVVLMGFHAVNSIKEYLEVRDDLATSESGDSLWLGQSGKPLSRSSLYKIVHKYLKQATDGKASPHVLRHTFATHLMDRGADLLAVKELLGHESLSTTQVYTHTSIEHLKKEYKKAHPKSRDKEAE